MVINIIDYKVGFRRHGAENDGTYMTKLWSQMGYKILKYEGYIGKTKFKSILDKFINSINRLNDLNTSQSTCQSCVVYIGCHGSKGKIDLSDGDTVNFYDNFIFEFGKLVPLNSPKIFVAQSCRTYVQQVSYQVMSETRERLDRMAPNDIMLFLHIW